MNSYINLSSYHSFALMGLTRAYRITKHARYFSHTEWGCRLMFPMDPDLADAYYMRYFAGTNYSMVICNPHFPVNADKRRKYAELRRSRPSMMWCIYYYPGHLKRLYEENFFDIVFETSFPAYCAFMVVAAVITIAGIFGEYQWLHSFLQRAAFLHIVGSFYTP